MRKASAWILIVLLMLTSVFVLASCESEHGESGGEEQEQQEEHGGSEEEEGSAQSGGQTVTKDGSYNSKEDVAEYLSIYRKLPKNYITKKEAKRLGWSGGSVEQVAPGKAIGGDRFGNYEKKLPGKKGRNYYECDIDTIGKKKRGPKRIIYSDDGLIYYTGNHYKSFQKMPQSA